MDEGAISEEEYRGARWLNYVTVAGDAGGRGECIAGATGIEKASRRWSNHLWDYYNAIGGTKAYMESMNGKKYTTYFELVTTGTNFHYTPPSGSSSSSSGSSNPTYNRNTGEFDYASGADFVIPPGYPNDSYPIGWGTSGERVTVTPSGKQDNKDLIAAIQASRVNTKQLARDIRDALLKVM